MAERKPTRKRGGEIKPLLKCHACGCDRTRADFKQKPSGRPKTECIRHERHFLTAEERDASYKAKYLGRTKEQRQEWRRREAERNGKEYAPRHHAEQRALVRRTARLLGAAYRDWFSICWAERSDEECKRQAREQWHAHYKAHRKQEIERSRLKKRRYRASAKRAGLNDRSLNAVRDSATHCGYCERLLVNGMRHMDHIIPLSEGGPTELWNLMAVCSECNTSKGARRLDVWLASQPTHIKDKAWSSVSAVMAWQVAVA